MVALHPEHTRCARQFEVAIGESNQLYTATHTLAELYAVLTRLPVTPRLLPVQARRLIEENVVQWATIVELDRKDYLQVIARMSELDLVSGAVYDGLHVRAAEKVGADFLYTLNGADFQRMPPDPPTVLKVNW